MKIFTRILLIFSLIFPLRAFSEDMSEPLPGRILGNESAQIIIEEYASMSCGHCASFHNNTLDKIKKEFIDTGKAKLVFL
jgi:protein-disulfide isomerase